MLDKTNINPKKQILIVYIVLTVVTLAVFWQVNKFDFINLDDNIYVTKNSHIRSGITLDGFRWAFGTKYYYLWHPLVWLSFILDYQLYGLNAGGYHLSNLILHILSTLLLFWLFNRMTKEIWKSAFIAALFALHPLHVESVAWISERKDVLSAFFWMLTLCLYVYYTEKPIIIRYVLVIFSFVLGLMSKPMVVTLPVIMILLDYWPLGRFQSRGIITNLNDTIPVSAKQGKQKNKSKKIELKKNISPFNKRILTETKITTIHGGRWQLWEKIPFFILSVGLIIVTFYTPSTQSPKLFPSNSRIANAPISFVTYLEKTFWPHDMAVFYPFSEQLPIWQVLGSTLLILVISAAVIVMAKRMPYLFVGWLWYAITLLPVIKLVQVGYDAMADRYHYLPSIGIAIMLAWGIPSLIKQEEMRKKILFPALIAFLIIMSILTWKQCGYWEKSTTLFSHTLQVTKGNDLIHNNLGVTLFDEGKTQEAINHYDEAIRITPNYDSAYYNRGNAYARLGKHQLAIDDFNKAISLNNDHVQAYINRGNAYARLSRHQMAIESYNEAIRLTPDNAYAYINRAFVYLNQGNKELGCRDALKACELGNCETLTAAKGKGYCH